MKAYAYEHTIKESGVLTLRDLPFSIGDQVEIIIIPRTKRKNDKECYPFWGKPITYPNPTDSVPESDWEVYK